MFLRFHYNHLDTHMYIQFGQLSRTNPSIPYDNKGLGHQMSSPEMFACLKYFIPTQATTTQTQAITAVRMISAG